MNEILKLTSKACQVVFSALMRTIGVLVIVIYSM